MVQTGLVQEHEYNRLLTQPNRVIFNLMVMVITLV